MMGAPDDDDHEEVPSATEMTPGAIQALVADPSAMRRSAISAALRDADSSLDTFEAGDGPAALTILREHPMDLVLVDRSLPRLDAGAFLSALEGRRRETLILLLSDTLMPQWQAVAAQIHAYDVLLKPFRKHHAKRVLRAYSRMRTPARVLLVDGTEAVRKLVRRMLAETRFKLEVEESHQARHALAMLRRSTYDVVLVDMALPDMSGLAAAVHIKTLSPDTRVVVLGTAPEASLGSALESIGTVGYLEKPFQAAHLERALHRAFGLWRPYVLNSRAAAA